MLKASRTTSKRHKLLTLTVSGKCVTAVEGVAGHGGGGGGGGGGSRGGGDGGGPFLPNDCFAARRAERRIPLDSDNCKRQLESMIKETLTLFNFVSQQHHLGSS